LPHGWLGPSGGALLAAIFLGQAQARSAWRLLGVPALALLLWLGLVWVAQAHN